MRRRIPNRDEIAIVMNMQEISTAGAVAGGVLLGMAGHAGLAHVVPDGMGPMALLPVLAALGIAAAVPGFLLRNHPVPCDEFAALDLLADEVWLIGRHSHVLRFANKAAVARSGPGALQGRTLWTCFPQDQHAVLRALMRTPDAPLDIVTGRQCFRASLSQVQDGRYLMLVLRDVTLARRDAATKDDFISTVSHELRSPLTSIKGSMGLLLSNAAGELPKPARGLLEIAHRNAERLVLIINDILDLQKITAGGMAFDAQQVDLAALVHEALAASSLFLQRFDLTIEVVGADAPVPLKTDPNRIIQVLGNLLTNAAKFSRPGGKITVTLAQAQRGVTISVRDEGAGIPKAEQDKIFERFADMTNSNRQQNGGSGLGLSICKAIVEILGGTIGFESVEKVGTTFHIFLPREQGARLEPPASGPMRYVG